MDGMDILDHYYHQSTCGANNYNFDNNCNFNEAGHEKLCSEAVDQRKMKNTGKERRQAGRDQMKETFVKFKKMTNKETEAGKEAIEVVKKMCKEMGKSKKGSESSSKAKAAAKK